MDLVYVFALAPAVLWGLSPIFSKRGMAAGGSSLQASLTVVGVDSTLYLSALVLFEGTNPLTNLTLESAALFLAAGIVGTALGRLAVFVVVGRRDVLEAPRRTYAYFAASGAITAVALLSLFAALRIGRVVIVDPLAATAPLFTVAFAAVLLRDLERITRLLVVGVVLVVIGVALVVASPSILG